MRMKVLLEADKVVMQLKAEAKLEVAKIAKTPDYKKLLEDLIVEVRVSMRCLAALIRSSHSFPLCFRSNNNMFHTY